MYFSGKSYFNPTIRRDVEIRTGTSKGTNTKLNKPKSRKKGKLTRKRKAKRKFNLTQLKKQLGNDMVIKLLLRLVEGKAGARPVGRPPQQPQTIKQPRKMRLARGSGLPPREKQKLEKKKQGETEQQFLKRVEDYVLENNPAFIYFSQLLQRDKDEGNRLIQEQIDALRDRPIVIDTTGRREGEIEPRFALELLRRLEVADLGNSKEDLRTRRAIVKQAQKEYQEKTGDELRSSDEERFLELADTKGKENRQRLSSKLQLEFAQAGRARKKAKERVVETTKTTTLGELGGESFDEAQRRLQEGFQSQYESSVESVSPYLDRFNTGQGFGLRGARNKRSPSNPLDRGAFTAEEEQLLLAQQFQPNPAPVPAPAPGKTGAGRPTFESQGLKTKAQLEKEAREEAKKTTVTQRGDTKVIGGGAIAGIRGPGNPGKRGLGLGLGARGKKGGVTVQKGQETESGAEGLSSDDFSEPERPEIRLPPQQQQPISAQQALEDLTIFGIPGFGSGETQPPQQTEEEVKEGTAPIDTETFDETLKQQERERRFEPLQRADTGEVEVASREPTGKVGGKAVARTGIESQQRSEVQKGFDALTREASRVGAGVVSSISSGATELTRKGLGIATQYKTEGQKSVEGRAYELEHGAFGRRGLLDDVMTDEKRAESREFQRRFKAQTEGTGEFSSEGEQAGRGYDTEGSGAEEIDDYFGAERETQPTTKVLDPKALRRAGKSGIQSGTETDVSAPDLVDTEGFGLTSGSETEYSAEEKDLDFERFKGLNEKQQRKAFSRLQGQLQASDRELQKQGEVTATYRDLLDSEDERQAQAVIEYNRQQRELAERQSVSGLPQDKELSQLNQEQLSGSESSVTSSLFREAEKDFDFTQPTPPGSVSSFDISTTSQSEPQQKPQKRKVKKSLNVIKRERDEIQQKIDDLQLTLGQGASTGGMALQAEGRTEDEIRREIQQLGIELDIKQKELEKRERKQAKRREPEPELALTSESEAETAETKEFLETQQKLATKQQTLTKRAKEILPKFEKRYETLLRRQEQESVGDVDESIEEEDIKANQFSELFDFRGEIEDEIYKLNQKNKEEEKLVNESIRADIAIKLLSDPENPELLAYEEAYGDLNQYTGLYPEQMTAKQVQAQLEVQKRKFREAGTRLAEFEEDRREALKGIKALEADSRRKQGEIYGQRIEEPFRIRANVKGAKLTPNKWKEYESEVLGYFVARGKLTEEERQQIINSETKKRKEIIKKIKGGSGFRREWLLPKENEYEKWWKSYVTANLKEINPGTAGRKPRTEEQKAQGGSEFEAQFRDYMETRLDGVTAQQKDSIELAVSKLRDQNQKIAKLFSGESQGKKDKESAFKTLENTINKALLTSGEGQSKSRKDQSLPARVLNTFVGDIEGDDLKYFKYSKGSLSFGGGSGISITTIQDEKNKPGSVYRVTDTKENKRYILRVMTDKKYRLEEDTENNEALVSKRKVIMSFN